MNPALRESVDLLLQYRALGESVDEEKLALEEELQEKIEQAWRGLSPEEMEMVWGISADLYMLEGAEVFQVPEPAVSPEEVWERAETSYRSSDLEAALKALRHGPAKAPAHRVAGIRGACYLKLGFADLALLFFQFAEGSAAEVDASKHRGYALLAAMQVPDWDYVERVLDSD